MAEQADWCQNVYDVCVFESRWTRSVRLSALVITRSDDVFGAGANTLVLNDSGNYPMKEGGEDVLREWVKIDKLCGLGIRKFVLSSSFGTALTNTNELLIWGYNFESIDDRTVLMIPDYQPNTRCQLCTATHDYTGMKVGKAVLNYCEVTQIHPTCTPHDRLPARKFFQFYGSSWGAYCTGCLGRCSSKLVNAIPLCYCEKCDLLLDFDDNIGLVESQQGMFLKRVIVGEGITDVAALDGLWVLTASNKLMRKSFTSLSVYWDVVINENQFNVKMKSFHACNAGKFVTSDDGGLYQMFWNPTAPRSSDLRKVALPAPIAKVCCEWYAVVCLLHDTSVYYITHVAPATHVARRARCTLPRRLVINDGAVTFLDIAAATSQDNFYIQAEPSVLKLPPKRNIDGITFIFSESNCNKKLLENVCSQPIPSTSTSSLWPDLAQSRMDTPPPDGQSGSPAQSCSAPSTSNSAPLPAFLSELYGQKLLSDVTLKLSDGDFPAHRCVLMTTSAYFNKTFASNTSLHVTLDVSPYNPSVYKCLLKHFYRQPPDELGLDGLFDLCQLAVTYGEIFIAKETEDKIRAKVNIDNALYIYALNKFFGYDQIEKYCEIVIKTAEFKDKLVEKAMRDPTIYLLCPDTDST